MLTADASINAVIRLFVCLFHLCVTCFKTLLNLLSSSFRVRELYIGNIYSNNRHIQNTVSYIRLGTFKYFLLNYCSNGPFFLSIMRDLIAQKWFRLFSSLHALYGYMHVNPLIITIDDFILLRMPHMDLNS